MPRYLSAAIVCLTATSSILAAQKSAVAQSEWPEFRGPTAQGHAHNGGLPLEWSGNKNVLWKQAVPGSGWSSPVFSRGKLFLTTGVVLENAAPSLRALSFDAGSGRLLWNTEVFASADSTVLKSHKKNSPASPTPIVQGDRIYVHFGPHGTACLDLEGKIIWKNNRLGYDPQHGNGGSPIIAGDLLIFNADGVAEPAVIALHRATGELAWKVPRNAEVKNFFSFCTPLLINFNGQPQVITPGSGAVSALNPQDGREIWRVRYGNGYSVVPRPVFAHGLLFIATGFNKPDLLAIRPDGMGDVTDTHIAWRTSEAAPLTPSFVVVGDELYGVSDIGVATCWDARIGTVHWQERLEGKYSASPLAADGRIYFQNETGTGTVIAPGKTFTKLATNELKEATLASYAVVESSFIIRTAGHIYRIGTPRHASIGR